jgi:lysophospholipase L1-like esterase
MYVALGDSMSIDDYAGGAGRGAASLLHRNRDADFPAWAGRDLASTGLTGLVLARDGARAADVLERQLPLITEPPAVVTITMGGNDLLTAWGDDAAARAAIGRVIAAGEVILARLPAAGGTGRIVISTVYDPSDGTGRLGPGFGSGLLPPWPGGLAAVRELNAALAGLAARHGAAVADVHGRFLGHGVTAGDPSQLAPMPSSRDLWYCGTIEPNAWGADQIRQTWWDALHTPR